MSKEQKPSQALNLYGILDNEMGRMHSLMQAYMNLPQNNAQTHYSSGSSYGGLSNSAFGASHSPSGMGEIYKRIIKMQDLLLKAVTEHDTVIQEKIAELALTGDPDETEV